MTGFKISDHIQVGDTIEVDLCGYEERSWVVKRINKGTNTLWIDYEGNSYNYQGHQTVYPHEIISVNGTAIDVVVGAGYVDGIEKTYN